MTPDRLLETVETLAGDRRRDRRNAAVRLVDLDGLILMGQRLQAAAPAGATPTAAEYDALRKDVIALHKALVAVAAALTARLT